MDVLCLFGLFPNEYRNEISRNSITGIQNAANKFQWGIVSGLDQIPGLSVHICNSVYIGSYPKQYRKINIPTFCFHHTDKADDINVGFCNLSIIKIFSRYAGIKKIIDAWASTAQKNSVVMAYAMTFPFVNMLNYIKKKYPNIIVCLVVPDLPEYMNVSKLNNKIYYRLKMIQSDICKMCISNVDCFVLLTDEMKKWFNRPIRYTVVEGIVPALSEAVNLKSIHNRKKSILYAGRIESNYGVVDMVKAFMQTSAIDWTLEIYGEGSALGEIRRISKDDRRVKIYGLVDNSVVIKLQQEVSLLINPRPNNSLFTRYSFPSKIIEYMISGTPVIAYQLDGIPNDYIPYFYKIEECENGLKNAITKAMLLPDTDRAAMGEKARQFILQNKNAKKQCEKIVEMITGCTLESK